MDRKKEAAMTVGKHERLKLLHYDSRIEEETRRLDKMTKACEKFMLGDPSIQFFFEIQQDMGHYSRYKRRRRLRMDAAASLRREEQKLEDKQEEKKQLPLVRTVDRKKMQRACQKFMIDDVHIAKQQQQLVQTIAKTNKNISNNAFKQHRKSFARSA